MAIAVQPPILLLLVVVSLDGPLSMMG
jgi:hypothetical protein